jgi:hypothetical protein
MEANVRGHLIDQFISNEPYRRAMAGRTAPERVSV